MTRQGETTGWMRRARRRRGAAMVEAVVAIPFFIIIFASMIYVLRLYSQKQRTLREAKQEAWAYALNNCEGNPGDVTTETEQNPASELNSANPPVPGPNAGIPQRATEQQGAAGGSDLTKNWGTASATVKANVVADKLIGGYTSELKTTTRMQCNEKPAEGSVKDVLKSAWHMFTQW